MGISSPIMLNPYFINQEIPKKNGNTDNNKPDFFEKSPNEF